MYVPPHFAVDDLARLDALVARDAFATLVSVHDGAPFASHVPLLYAREGERVRISGHWARPNPQWRTIGDQTVLCIVHGPHAYVSPNDYPEPAARVPTWNYAVAHLYGTLRIVEQAPALLALVSAMADRFERERPLPWSLASADPSLERLAAGIVGFEMDVQRIELKFKLSQNHPVEIGESVARAFLASSERDEQLLGQWMDANARARRARA